jgi:hypothetical protein
MSVARMVIGLRATFTCIGDVTIGVLVGWVPLWHTAPSLVRISHLGLPWPVIGSLFILGGLLTVSARVRAWGYGISAVLFFVGAYSLAAVSIAGPPANAVSAVGLFMVSGFLTLGVMTAQEDWSRRDDQ